jgi:hypothetical protein
MTGVTVELDNILHVYDRATGWTFNGAALEIKEDNKVVAVYAPHNWISVFFTDSRK